MTENIKWVVRVPNGSETVYHNLAMAKRGVRNKLSCSAVTGERFANYVYLIRVVEDPTKIIPSDLEDVFDECFPDNE